MFFFLAYFTLYNRLHLSWIILDVWLRGGDGSQQRELVELSPGFFGLWKEQADLFHLAPLGSSIFSTLLG